MTRDDCKRILDNLEIVRHFSEGGDVESCMHDYKGEFIRWSKSRQNSILISCLDKYRICKPHLKLTLNGTAIPEEKHPCTRFGRH